MINLLTSFVSQQREYNPKWCACQISIPTAKEKNSTAGIYFLVSGCYNQPNKRAVEQIRPAHSGENSLVNNRPVLARSEGGYLRLDNKYMKLATPVSMIINCIRSLYPIDTTSYKLGVGADRPNGSPIKFTISPPLIHGY